MKETKTIYSGKVSRDRFGSWSDCDPGLYIGDDMVETIVGEFSGRYIKITIEEVEEPECKSE